jgi:hypothetical protein
MGGVGDVGGIVVAAAGDVGIVDVDRAGGGDRAGGIVRLAIAVHAVVAGTVETRGWRGVRDVGSAGSSAVSAAQDMLSLLLKRVASGV